MWKDRFDFLGFRSIEERRENGEVYSEFTIKLQGGGGGGNIPPPKATAPWTP